MERNTVGCCEDLDGHMANKRNQYEYLLIPVLVNIINNSFNVGCISYLYS